MKRQGEEVLVIYRLKFKMEPDYERASQTLRFGQGMARYLESLQRSFGLQPSQGQYLAITPPEINFCKDDLVIYICSYEVGHHSKIPSANDNIMPKGMTENMPRFPYFFEPFLRINFGSNAEISIATGAV
jgi:hypothetical protein